MRVLTAYFAGASTGIFLTVVFFWLARHGLAKMIGRAAAGLGSLLPAKRERRVPTLPMTDTQTGLLNRRGFQPALFSVVRDAEKSHRSVALLLIELDHTRLSKERSDGGGEDQTILRLVQILRDTSSALDLVARYGADQFVMVMQGAHADDGLVRALRIRAALARGCTALPVSIGVADIDRAGGWHARGLLAAADGALYAAKASGGDRAFIASTPGLVRRARSSTPVPELEEKPWVG